MGYCKRLNRARGTIFVLSGGIFALMLALNILTPYICDDFTYRINFSSGQPLNTFPEIIPSMYAHSFTMNGRLISHGLAQVFMLLPPLVFDICNAAVFAVTLYLIHRLCAGACNGLLLGGMFCLFWLFTPAFGQVVLWQVGALNYFWSLTGCVLFFAPYLLRFQNGQDLLRRKRHWAAFCLYAFFFGWYNEIASFVGMCMAVCLILLDLRMNRSRLRIDRFLPIVAAAAGYLVMFSAPAQSSNKQAQAIALGQLLTRAGSCTFLLLKFCAPLLAIFAVLLILGLRCRMPAKTMILSGLFALAGICANYMPIVATYYPERCMCTTVLMLIMAIGFLAAPLARGKGFAVFAAGCTVLFALTLPAGIIGCRDIASCHRQHIRREQTIAASIASGDLDVTANTVIPQTHYSGYWDVRDLTDDPNTWPNHDMARYYGLDSLIGE